MNSSMSCVPNADELFGPQVASCRRDFDFTLLFEQSILSIGPTAIFLLFVPVRLSQLGRTKRKTLPNLLRDGKLVAISVFLSLQVAMLVLWVKLESQQTRVSVPASALSVIASLSLGSLSILENDRSIRPSLLICTFLLISLVVDVAQARTLWLLHESTVLPALFTTSLIFKALILQLEAFEKRSFLKEPFNEYPPESLASVINRNLFLWINKLILEGQKSILSVGDLFDIDKALSSSVLERGLRASWKRRNSKRRNSLLFSVLSYFKGSLLALVFPRLCLVGFKFSQPLLINRAISLIEEPETSTNRNIGYAIIGATALIYLGLAISTAKYQHKIFRVITMIRGGLICLTYDATLNLDSNSMGDSASITLMSTDIERIGNGLATIDSLLAGPIEAGIAIYLLEKQLGIACIVPVLISLACTLGAFSIMKWAKNTQKEWIEAVQKRVAITSSALSSMKGIKMQGLTDRLSEDLQELRVQELEFAKPFRRNIIATAGISNITVLCGPFATFITYIVIERSRDTTTLSIAQAFTSLSLISLLSSPVSELVQTIPTFAAALGCFDRIQEYISMENRQDSRFGKLNADNALESENSENKTDIIDSSFALSLIRPSSSARLIKENIITVKDATFSISSERKIILKDINLDVRHGALIMIVGAMGSGKSNLLKALLGEIPCTKGSLINKSTGTAYCSQTAWLPNSTVREIILGTSEYDDTWYYTIINACVLGHDISLLPEREHTMIGSEGAALSGGQKQRLALARALYSRKGLLLVDDILSGLDSKTDHAVFENVFGRQGFCNLHNLTTIFTTHAVQHLPSADKIIALSENGEILEQGTFDNLRQKPDGYIKDLLFHEVTKIQPEADVVVSQTTRKAPLPADDNSTRQNGDFSVYLYFAKSFGWFSIALFLGTVGIYTFTSEFQAVLLQYWSKSETDQPGVYTNIYIGLYAMLSVFAVFGIMGMLCVMLLFAGPYASINLHRILLDAVMNAPYSWFVATDTGVTLNRFSQDMSLIDMELLVGVIDTFAGSFMAVAEAILISIGAKYVGVILPLIIGILYILQKVYLRTSRQLRLLDLETKSPLYSHSTETLSGLTTIRAFGWQEQSAEKNRRLSDNSQKPYYLLYCIQRWLNLVLDLILAGIAVVLIAFATKMRGTTNAGTLGIALVNILQFNTTLSFLIRKWTQLETSIGAVARVKVFEATTLSENRPEEINICPLSWPSRGKIEFKDVTTSYSISSSPVLRNISLTIESGQKVGIVGRTGSGKSSLILTLLRMLDLTSGSILIDDISLCTKRRQSLRASLIAIPQEPNFLSGTVRFNADPFRSSPDTVIIASLTKVGLWDLISSNGGGLDTAIDTAPLSQGQKQLFCLARALVRKSALGNREKGILVLDEDFGVG
ncbi:hypothetical protein G7Y89_g8798 [Cudoniella acicularis]|uniref:Uncharacterized protein n=1 Tax=Cudoniella acicularis TaxID=354080 RepID=A0A8H4RI74_9HELO|nr:hypothetical protein G7Y89_g8798 [Cudoniella acicularis]